MFSWGDGVRKLKSVFILCYPAAVVIIGLWSGWRLATGDAKLAWAGTLLTVLPFAGLYIRATTADTLARSSHNLPVLSLLTAAGVALALWGTLAAPDTAWTPLGLAAVGAAGFFLFDFWYSSFGRRLNERLAPGRILPAFRARDADGHPVGSADLLGQPALYIFHRGNWCPFCRAQVQEITARYRELARRGTRVVLVSPLPHDLSQRVAGILEVPMDFWVDPDLAAARELGIVDPQGVPAGPLRRRWGSDTVLPTVIITDARGRILYSDQTDNYRVRPDPEIFIRVLNTHGIGAGPPQASS